MKQNFYDLAKKIADWHTVTFKDADKAGQLLKLDEEFDEWRLKSNAFGKNSQRNFKERILRMAKPIEDYTADELSAKIEAIKAERERTANALKKYEEELERRKQEVPLGVPINTGSKELFCVSGVNTILPVKENFSLIAELSDVLNLFHSKESAKKHTEMLLDWRKALVANSKGEPIDIKVLLPLLKKGWVAMDKNGDWYLFENKPYADSQMMCWRADDIKFFQIRAFNLKPATDWEDSLMECGG